MRWHEGHRSCRDECRMSCKQCDKLRSVAKHPKGNAGVPVPIRFINGFTGTAALVWRIYLPNRHEEHRFTLQRGHC